MAEIIHTHEGDFEVPRDCYQGGDWRIHYSPQCRKFGDGQCDGWCDHGECNCPCHHDPELPRTVVEVTAWHHKFWEVVPCTTANPCNRRACDDCFRRYGGDPDKVPACTAFGKGCGGTLDERGICTTCNAICKP